MDYKNFFLILLSISTGLCLRTWTCDDNNQCVKNDTTGPQVALSVCKLTCLPNAAIWPRINGNLSYSKQLINVNIESIQFESNDLPEETKSLLNEAEQIFLSRVKGVYSADEPITETDNDFILSVNIKIENPKITYYATNADESYHIVLKTVDTEHSVVATISAETFLGARHGLETLAQLIIYDDLNESFKMLAEATIDDKPSYTFRGLGLDTARSYYSVNTLLKIIDGMAQNKLNSFRWHITDTHSFPYVSKKYPEMSEIGAYAKNKVYTADDIKKIVQYARVRGVRVTPEFDAPAHVGEGWQAVLGGKLTTCFGWLPWTSYCVEPPCGQFDPTQEQLYPILADIYEEYSELFVSDLFHMGGDEVNVNCWQSTPNINQYVSERNWTMLQLWDMFQEKALAALKKSQPNVPAILWTNSLTDQVDVLNYLDPQEYIIQIWSAKTDQSIARLVNNNYRVIFSNYDELYLDCGGAAWIGGPGQNWCSPYKGWQTVYLHNPEKIVTNLGVTVTDAVRSNILGSEGAIWSEQLDDGNIQGRFFPRAAALSERLWSNPQEDWSNAQYRMNYHRERIVRNGITAELLQPTWCLHNDGQCGEH